MFTGLLGHTCAVERRTVGEDGFGQPLDVWEVWKTAVPCRVTRPNGREQTTMVGKDVVEVTHVLYCDVGVGLSEAHRVRDVKDPDNVELVSEADILLVRRVSGGQGQGHHLEALLRAVKDQ